VQRLGAHDLLVLMFVALVLDSRRFRALVRLVDRGRRRSTKEGGIPPGADPTRVGLPLRQIQMRNHVDWQDGGIGWDGPEVLPVDDSADEPADTGDVSATESPSMLPVLWKPFPMFLPLPGDSDNCVESPHMDASRDRSVAPLGS